MKIGIYCGSFNPFHLGHLDIAQKAQKVFDKVIIVQACNQEKHGGPISSLYGAKSKLEEKGFDVRFLDPDQLLTSFMKSELYYERMHSKPHEKDNINFSLIRGLRNANDLIYEQNLQQAYKVTNGGEDVNCVYFFSDIKYNFLSSSLIRSHPEAFRDYIYG